MEGDGFLPPGASPRGTVASPSSILDNLVDSAAPAAPSSPAIVSSSPAASVAQARVTATIPSAAPTAPTALTAATVAAAPTVQTAPAPAAAAATAAAAVAAPQPSRGAQSKATATPKTPTAATPAPPSGAASSVDPNPLSPHSPPCSPVPSFREKYDLHEQLGKGAFSTVYRCTNRHTQEVFAVKVIDLRPLRLRAGFDVKRLLRECVIMRALSHPNIIGLHEVFEEPDELLMVLEYCKGKELFDEILARNQYSEDDARPIFKCLSRACAFLHNKGIIHRDIKPENVKIDSGGVVKLLDFGLAKATGDHFGGSAAKTFVGTPCYLAPEVEMTRESASVGYGVEVDCWSLGATLYVMLCARFPEFDRSSGKPMVRVSGPLWEGVSDSAKDLVRRLMDPDPRQRLSASKALEHPWVTQSDPPPDALVVLSGATQRPDLQQLGADDASPLVLLHQRVCRLFETALAAHAHHPGVAHSIRDCASLGRTLMLDTCLVLRKLHGVACQILDSLSEVLLAVSEDEPKLAHNVMALQRKWISKVRDDMKRSKHAHGELVKAVGVLMQSMNTLNALPAPAMPEPPPPEPQEEFPVLRMVARDQELVQRLQSPGSNDSSLSQEEFLSLMAPSVELTPPPSPGSARSANREDSSDEASLDHLPHLLRQIDRQLDGSAVLWANIDVVFEALEQKGELAEQFVDFSHNPLFMKRFQTRMSDYQIFWSKIRDTASANMAQEDVFRMYSFLNQHRAGT